MMDLLIVEDERSLADDIKAYLDGPGVRCAIAGTVREALDNILDTPFDRLVLDLTLPGWNGLEVLRELKGMGRTDGVMVVSAKDALDDRIEGLRTESVVRVAQLTTLTDKVVQGAIGEVSPSTLLVIKERLRKWLG